MSSVNFAIFTVIALQWQRLHGWNGQVHGLKKKKKKNHLTIDVSLMWHFLSKEKRLKMEGDKPTNNLWLKERCIHEDKKNYSFTSSSLFSRFAPEPGRVWPLSSQVQDHFRVQIHLVHAGM